MENVFLIIITIVIIIGAIIYSNIYEKDFNEIIKKVFATIPIILLIQHSMEEIFNIDNPKDNKDIKFSKEFSKEEFTSIEGLCKVIRNDEYYLTSGMIHGFKYPHFREEEFKNCLTIENLCNVINYDIKISLRSPCKTICQLNNLLENPNFHDVLDAKKPNINFSEKTVHLVNETKEYRNKQFSDLNNIERYNIKKLNRLLLEETYPQQTPRCPDIVSPPSQKSEPDKEKHDIALDLPHDTEHWLNGVLRLPNFYDTLITVKSNNFSKEIKSLVNKTEKYRNRIFNALTDEKQNNIKKLNRLLLEETYPQQTPSSSNEKTFWDKIIKIVQSALLCGLTIGCLYGLEMLYRITYLQNEKHS